MRKVGPPLCVLVASVWFGCASPEEYVYSGPDGEAYVATEVAALPADGSFDYSVETFAESRADGRRLSSPTAQISVADRSDESNRIEVSDVVSGPEAPASHNTLGGGRYVVLNGAARISLSRPGTLLGLHLNLSVLGAREHRSLYAGTGMIVRFTGRSIDGRWMPTLRAEVAFYDGRDLFLTTDWTWIDLSELGPVSEMLVEIETPLADDRRLESNASALLIDNLTVSEDYRPDGDYFSLALVPGIGNYAGDREIAEAQLRFLKEARTGEHVRYAAFFGGVVSDAEDEEGWNALSDLLLGLVEEMPFGIALAPGDYARADDREEGSPLFLDAFPEDRFRDARWWGGRSEDELSSWQLIGTPLGEIVFLDLSVDTPAETLDWAQTIIDDNRHTPVVVVIDRYLTDSGRYAEPAFPESVDGLAPDQFFDQFVRANPEIFLILCSGGQRRLQLSRHRTGSPVIEMSSGFTDHGENGGGYVEILRFYPERREMRILAYSPWLNQILYGLDGMVVVPIDLENSIP